MGENQWCLRVSRSGAEETRRKLLDEGVLDRTLKIRQDGEDLLFPVTTKTVEGEMAEFEVLRQKVELPRHELVGGIAILAEDDPAGAALILKERPSVHTALIAESGVEGEFRTKRFRVLAGEITTATTHTEYGRFFRIDLEKAYFSARLASERQRIVSMMDNHEIVLDMFAGVGPFAIMLATKAEQVWACDLNPGAVSLLIRNISQNKMSNIVPMLADASSLPEICGRRFDRIIMNLPLMAEIFLPSAFALCKSGGMIHLYALESDEKKRDFDKMSVQSINRRFVRSYAPGKSHMVYDIRVR